LGADIKESIIIGEIISAPDEVSVGDEIESWRIAIILNYRANSPDYYYRRLVGALETTERETLYRQIRLLTYDESFVGYFNGNFGCGSCLLGDGELFLCLLRLPFGYFHSVANLTINTAYHLGIGVCQSDCQDRDHKGSDCIDAPLWRSSQFATLNSVDTLSTAGFF
jgi:hypothetical protein